MRKFVPLFFRLVLILTAVAAVSLATPQRAAAWFGYEVYVTAHWSGSSNVTCKDAALIINGKAKNYSMTQVDSKTCRAKFVDVQDGTGQFYINAIEGKTWFYSGKGITTGVQKTYISGGNWWRGTSIWYGPYEMRYP